MFDGVVPALNDLPNSNSEIEWSDMVELGDGVGVEDGSVLESAGVVGASSGSDRTKWSIER